jgi:hypothetical protein
LQTISVINTCTKNIANGVSWGFSNRVTIGLISFFFLLYLNKTIPLKMIFKETKVKKMCHMIKEKTIKYKVLIKIVYLMKTYNRYLTLITIIIRDKFMHITTSTVKWLVDKWLFFSFIVVRVKCVDIHEQQGQKRRRKTRVIPGQTNRWYHKDIILTQRDKGKNKKSRYM